MRNNIYNLLSLFMLLLSVVCSCKDDEEPITLSELTFPSTENLNPILPKEGGEASISFTALSKWAVDIIKTETKSTEEEEEEWIIVTPEQGGAGEATITIKILTPNDTYTERSATINLVCGETIKKINVIQKGRSEKDDLEEALKLERKALVDFYKMTNGDGWKNNSGWCSEKPVSSWYGVSTDGQGRVTRISMDRNNLIGRFPESIGNLKELRYLRLHNNYLYGELPEGFYDLTKLEYFQVSNTNFGSEGGTIVIDPNNPEAPTLGRNQLSGRISEKIGNLKNLYEFGACQNCFTGELPKAIWTLTKLQALLLTHNHNNETDECLYGEIPEDIGNLKKLRQLWLDGNNFSGKLPEAITTLESLEELIIGYNSFTGELPKEIGNLKRLRQFTCGYNLFTGELPESFYNLTNLDCIDIRGVARGGTAVVWADGVHKVVNSNQFTGKISDKIKHLKKLDSFSISGNKFLGKLPEGIYELPKLRVIDVSDNNISGTLSEKLGNLKTLENFQASACSLSGKIPESIRELKELQNFIIEFNSLEGELPIGITELPKIISIWLQGNNLTGNLPAGLKECGLVIFGNRLSGIIPNDIASWERWKTCNINSDVLQQQEGYGLSLKNDGTQHVFKKIRGNVNMAPRVYQVGNQKVIETEQGRINIPLIPQ